MPNGKTRVEVKLPEPMLKRVEAYQEEHGISTRSAAVMELLRIGLKATSGDGK